MDTEPSPTPSGTSVARRKRRTHASLFIVESVGFEDERESRLEGDILSQILRLSGKNTEYRYIRTAQELEVVISQFADSDLRYLHLSCHGNAGALYTTLDEVPFDELGRLLRPHLKERRVFVSACEAVNAELAEALMPGSGCYSIIGPAGDVGFDEAAVIWASFYHLMFKLNMRAMKQRDISSTLTELVRTFDQPMTYIRQIADSPYWRELLIDGSEN